MLTIIGGLIDEFIIGNVVSLSIEDEIMIYASNKENVTDEQIIDAFTSRRHNIPKDELIIMIASLRKGNLI